MRKRAYTLVEMMVVVAVLTTMAALVVPRYASLQAGQDSRDFSSALVRLGSDARLLAIQTGQEVQASFDDERRVLVLSSVDAETLQTAERRTIPLPEGIELTAFTLDGQFAEGSTWVLQFFPDGSGSDAGVEVEDGMYVYHVVIEGRDGTAVRTDGRLEEVEQLEWQAGELEQRVQ